MPARQLRPLPPRQDDAMAELADLVTAMTPRQLEAFAASLPRDDLALLEAAMAERHAMGWRADPASMAAHLDRKYRLRRYLQLLSRKWVDGVEGRSTRQIWNLPGRYGKSTLVRWGLTWCLDRRPDSRSMLISYGDVLADEGAIEVRDNLRRHADVLRAQLRQDRQRLDRFATDQGGGLLARGISSGIWGFGVSEGGVLVVDDPMKGWQEAHSEAARKKVYEQFRGTLRNRLDDENAFILVVHHRLHEDDLTARLTEAAEDEMGEEWDVTALPALATVGDPLGREPGEPLDPELFPEPAVKRRALALGTYLAAALEQQNPTPEEGDELLREWFRLEETLPLAPDQALTSWDLKLKNREAGDYVVGQVWWRTGPDFWLMDQLRGRYDHATTATAIALLAVRHPEVRRHVVEAAGSYDEVVPELRKPRPDYVVTPEMAGRLGMTADETAQVQRLRRRGMGGLIGNTPKGDKSVRARTYIAPTAEAGNVHLPAHAPFTPHFLDECAAFPNGANDDQVDAASQALQKLARGGAKAKASKKKLPAQRPDAARATAPAPARTRAPRPSSVRAPGGVLPRRPPTA